MCLMILSVCAALSLKTSLITMAKQSEQVFMLSSSEKDKSADLKVFLEAHPGVDLNLRKTKNNYRALHAATYRDNATTVRLLIDAKADLEARTSRGVTSLLIASEMGSLDCLQVLIESKADVQTAVDGGMTPAHNSARNGDHECLRLLIDVNANVNAISSHGYTPAMVACHDDRLACLQMLVDANADLSITTSEDLSCLCTAMEIPTDKSAQRVPGMPFAVLSCNTDTKRIPMDEHLTQAIVNAHINEYKSVHNFIDEWHSIAKHALNEDVEVDKRVGRHGNGIYHEPLEQVLLYLGLSMKQNQTVNTSIDGKTIKRALMPGHPINANLWFELYQRTHCASCSARLTEPKKKCPCDTARYCNANCQRQHWPAHKLSHKAAMLKKRNAS
jgi:ankyrin repeat protein